MKGVLRVRVSGGGSGEEGFEGEGFQGGVPEGGRFQGGFRGGGSGRFKGVQRFSGSEVLLPNLKASLVVPHA